MNSVNKDLRDYRIAIEHYERILNEDQLISNGELDDDGRPSLSNEDIYNIQHKLTLLRSKRDELLSSEKDLENLL